MTPAAATITIQLGTPLERVLNNTDSEHVFVERPDELDAVILKSTTVVSNQPAEIQ